MGVANKVFSIPDLPKTTFDTISLGRLGVTGQTIVVDGGHSLQEARN